MASRNTGKAGSEMERSRGWTKADGFFTIRKWNGTKNYIEGLIPSVVAGGADSFDISNQGPTYYLTARYSKIAGVGTVAETASELWQLDGEDFTKSIYANSLCVSLAAIQPSIWVQVQSAVDQNLAYEAYAFDFGALTAPQIVQVRGIFNLVVGGTDSFRASAYVLRRTRRASPAYAFGTELNINKIYTRAQILGLYPQIPTVLQDRMPTTGYWLKGTPTTMQAADNKYEDSVSWTHADDYSTLLYALAT